MTVPFPPASIRSGGTPTALISLATMRGQDIPDGRIHGFIRIIEAPSRL